MPDSIDSANDKLFKQLVMQMTQLVSDAPIERYIDSEGRKAFFFWGVNANCCVDVIFHNPKAQGHGPELAAAGLVKISYDSNDKKACSFYHLAFAFMRKLKINDRSYIGKSGSSNGTNSWRTEEFHFIFN